MKEQDISGWKIDIMIISSCQFFPFFQVQIYWETPTRYIFQNFPFFSYLLIVLVFGVTNLHMFIISLQTIQ